MIRFGMDARDVFAPRPRGTGKAMSALLSHLLPRLTDWSVSLYTDRGADERFPAPARPRTIDIPGSRWNTWERVRLPLAALVDRLDLLHCPSQTAPPLVPCPVVLTVHDLIPLRVPGEWPPDAVRRFEGELRRSAKIARRIIAVSEFTRRDLVTTFGVSEDKVDVVSWGVDLPVCMGSSGDEWPRLAAAVGLRSPFYVAFGGEAPRKNVTGILQALARFTRETTADVQLALVGVSDRVRPRFVALAESLGVAKSVVMLEYVADAELALLLANAEALVYASLFEGFGLPILEAMAAGTPVIYSDLTSMPEVAGDAGLAVDPSDPDDIARAMGECYLNETVKSELRERGLRRAAAFPWTRTAESTLAVYQRALGA
jgi:glycosyltransferase involved in cell wall biosynthesis